MAPSLRARRIGVRAFGGRNVAVTAGTRDRFEGERHSVASAPSRRPASRPAARRRSSLRGGAPTLSISGSAGSRRVRRRLRPGPPARARRPAFRACGAAALSLRAAHSRARSRPAAPRSRPARARRPAAIIGSVRRRGRGERLLRLRRRGERRACAAAHPHGRSRPAESTATTGARAAVLGGDRRAVRPARRAASGFSRLRRGGAELARRRSRVRHRGRRRGGHDRRARGFGGDHRAVRRRGRGERLLRPAAQRRSLRGGAFACAVPAGGMRSPPARARVRGGAAPDRTAPPSAFHFEAPAVSLRGGAFACPRSAGADDRRYGCGLGRDEQRRRRRHFANLRHVRNRGHDFRRGHIGVARRGRPDNNRGPGRLRQRRFADRLSRLADRRRVNLRRHGGWFGRLRTRLGVPRCWASKTISAGGAARAEAAGAASPAGSFRALADEVRSAARPGGASAAAANRCCLRGRAWRLRGRAVVLAARLPSAAARPLAPAQRARMSPPARPAAAQAPRPAAGPPARSSRTPQNRARWPIRRRPPWRCTLPLLASSLPHTSRTARTLAAILISQEKNRLTRRFQQHFSSRKWPNHPRGAP